MHARQTKRLTYSRAWIEFVLGQENAIGLNELVDTPLVHLISDADFAPTFDTLGAAFAAAEATFTDYAPKALVLTGPRSVGGTGRAMGGVVNWLMTTDPVVTGQRIYGYWIQDAARVVAHEIFAAGDRIDMSNVGDSLILETLLPLPYRVDISGEVPEV